MKAKIFRVICLLLLFIMSLLFCDDVNLIGTYPAGYSKNICVDENRDYVFASSGCGVLILDSSMEQVNVIITNYYVNDIFFLNDKLYIANEANLIIFDVTDINIPYEIGSYSADDGVSKVTISGEYAYTIIDYDLQILNISQPSNIVELGNVESAGNYCIKYYNDYIYTSSSGWSGNVIDVSNPEVPFIAGSFSATSSIYDLDIMGNYLFTVGSHFSVFNITDPTNPTDVTSFSCYNNGGSCIYIDQNTAFVGCGDYFVKYDISNPQDPDLDGWTEIDDGSISDISVSNNVVLGSGRNTIYRRHKSTLYNDGSYYTGSVSSISAIGDYVFVANGEYLSILDVENLQNPIEICHNSDDFNPIDVLVDSDFAYLASDEFKIVNYQFPSSPNTIYSWGNDITNVYIADDYAYVTSDHNLNIIDISDPYNPLTLGDTYISEEINNIFVLGEFAYLAVSNGMSIVHIGDPNYPNEIVNYETPSSAQNVFVKDDYAYVTNGSNDLRIIDVSDPAYPIEISYYDAYGYARYVHIENSIAYLLASAGLEILDLIDPINPIQIGFYESSYSNHSKVITFEDYIYISEPEFGVQILQYQGGSGINNNIISGNSVLISNYPNPFNPSTTIEFSIQNDSYIELTIFNIKGQKIKNLVNNESSRGNHSIIWNGDDDFRKPVSSGIYYYKLNINGKSEVVKKCLLLK
ncbi:MAG: T9SS type A sorting domain-containing protein [Bacteroidales bacterium]|nr:T9SS type A sorting domain-containing protein [Bacteroidales bacterium]